MPFSNRKILNNPLGFCIMLCNMHYFSRFRNLIFKNRDQIVIFINHIVTSTRQKAFSSNGIGCLTATRLNNHAADLGESEKSYARFER
jgi:hypothetical protein